MARSERTEEEARISNMLEAALSQRQQREPRWDRNNEYYKGEYPKRDKPWAFAADGHVPVIRPAVDSVAGMVADTVFSQDPVVTAITVAEDPLAEQCVQTYLDEAKAARKFRASLQHAGRYGVGIVHAAWKEGLKLKSIDPTNLVAYPATLSDPNDCLLVGHRYWRTLGEVKWMQEQGMYDKDVDVSASGGKSEATDVHLPESEANSVDSQAVENDDQEVEIYRLVIKGFDGKREIIEFAKDSEVIIHREDYKWSRIDYFFIQLFEEEEEVWPETSLAYILQPLQIEADHTFNAMLDAVDWASKPALMSPKGGATQEQYKRFEPGAWHQAPGLSKDQLVSFAGNQQFVPFIQVLEFILTQVDKSARISRASQAGAMFKKDMTATETEAVVMGDQASRDDYVSNAGTAVEDLAAFVWEMVKAHPEELQERIGRGDFDVKGPLDEQLNANIRWELTGRTTASVPMNAFNILLSVLGQLAQLEDTGVDTRKYVQRMFELLERAGIINAEGLQHPDDGSALITELADVIDIPAEIIAAMLKQLQETYARPEQVPQSPPGMVPGGPGINPGGAGNSPFLGEVPEAPGAGGTPPPAY